MRIHQLLTLLFLCIVMFGCEEKDPEIEKEYGYVLFYTDAQYLLNCGEFDVTVNIDDEECGVLKQPFLPLDSIPSCAIADTNTALKLKMDIGSHDYSASFYCSGENEWTGSFDIEKDNCKIIYLRLRQNQN